MVSLYDMSIPIFVKALENLKHVLQAGEKWAKENDAEPDKLLNARLAPDMNPLTFQVQSASDTSKGVLTRLAGQEKISMEDNEKTFEDCYERIQKTIDVLKTAKREDFEGKEDAEVSMFGDKVKFTGIEYIQVFALPNFFFHATTAYAILRKEGVPVGKLDFIAGGRQM